jgi:hypothetical protein
LRNGVITSEVFPSLVIASILLGSMLEPSKGCTAVEEPTRQRCGRHGL